jgi:hypothetical protein
VGSIASPVIPSGSNVGNDRFSDEEAGTIRRFLERVTFPIYDNLDVIFTSVGPADVRSSFTARCFDAAGLSASVLHSERGWYGDIAGLPVFDDSRIKEAPKRLLANFEEVRLLGLQRRQLQATARNGVVAVFVNGGKDRENNITGREVCLLHCITQGVVTDAVIDVVAAKTLAELTEVQSEKPRKSRKRKHG